MRRRSWLESFVEKTSELVKPMIVADKNRWVAERAEQAQRDSDAGRKNTLWRVVSQYRGKKKKGAKHRAAVELRDGAGKPIDSLEGKHAFWVQRFLKQFGGAGEHLSWPDFLARAQQLQVEVRALRDRDSDVETMELWRKQEQVRRANK